MTTLGCALLLGSSATGCGTPPPENPDDVDPSRVTPNNVVVDREAANMFDASLKQLAAHDDKNDWTDVNCKAVAASFIEAAEKQESARSKYFFQARYNAGLAHQRCKQDVEAKKVFSALLAKDPKFHRARVQVALYDFQASGEKAVDEAIGQMRQAITDAEFKNVEALVNLAMLQMRRDGSEGERGCENDFDCAKLNLQRALAINDTFMPAFNQLAVYYLESAKKKAGRAKGRVQAGGDDKKRADTQALELASLVCSQAIRKNPRYAPVHNTSGLISAELGDLSSAAQAFGLARRLGPKFFEAHMNYAAVNLQFRGFKQAEDAYRQALKLRPNDYEAHLGLALAIRGLTSMSDANYDQKIAEVEKELGAAKSVDSSRPETYYNQAILTQEFKARAAGDPKKAKPVLLAAKSLYNEFVQKAGSDEMYAAAVARATERMEEIDQIIDFAEQTEKEQKMMEEMRKQREAAEQLKKDAGG